MRRPIFSKTERQALGRWCRQAIGLSLMLLGAALTLALLSYDPTDSGVFSDSWRGPSNWLGEPGAYAADLLMRSFGIAGYAAAALVLMWGARILWKRWISAPLKRVAIAPIALFAAAVFASAHAVTAPGGGGLGGLLGDFGFGVLAEGLPLENAKARLILATLIALALAAPAMLFAFGAEWSALAWAHREARGRIREAAGLLSGKTSLSGLAAAVAGAASGARARSHAPDYDDEPPLSERTEPDFAARTVPAAPSAFDDLAELRPEPSAAPEIDPIPEPTFREPKPQWDRARIFPWVSRGTERGAARTPDAPPLTMAPAAPRDGASPFFDAPLSPRAPEPRPAPAAREVPLPSWLEPGAAAPAADDQDITIQRTAERAPDATQAAAQELADDLASDVFDEDIFADAPIYDDEEAADAHWDEYDPRGHLDDDQIDPQDAPLDDHQQPHWPDAAPAAAISMASYAEQRRRSAAAAVYEVGPHHHGVHAVSRVAVGQTGEPDFDDAAIYDEFGGAYSEPAALQPTDEATLDTHFQQTERRQIIERARAELTGGDADQLTPMTHVEPRPAPEPAPMPTPLPQRRADDPHFDPAARQTIEPQSFPSAPEIDPLYGPESPEEEDDLPLDGRPLGPAEAPIRIQRVEPEPAPLMTFDRVSEAAPERPRPSFQPPALDLLTEPEHGFTVTMTERMLAEQADRLQGVLNDYGIKGDIIDVHPGPVVTLFELEPAPGLKAARVIGLADDIARSMSAVSARISTIPGRNVIGIELPNAERETVLLRALLDHQRFRQAEGALPLALGKDIAGEPVIANLARMPHLLIAGTTGSGKSVSVNAMILSLLYRLSPDQVRMIMIDPKMLELSVYNDIPHLLAPVVTDPKKAVHALKWAVREMERRYERMADLGVRGIDSYNQRVAELKAQAQHPADAAAEPMPRIVVIVDEMADLMLVAGKEIEHCIQRLAQMARAAGIHLIMATQRPSVDVITGTIKANFPIRISFQVTSKIDSRTILGEQGAEQLLGRGDMLYSAGGARLTRIHGPFVSDEEVEEVAAHLRAYGPPEYRTTFEEDAETAAAAEEEESTGPVGDAELYDRAVALVVSERKASTSFIQRRLSIGYNRAARIIEMMEAEGVVSPANHVGKREILVQDDD